MQIPAHAGFYKIKNPVLTGFFLFYALSHQPSTDNQQPTINNH